MTNIILVGNPNTGKTTLFNTLSKSNNHVGNWHGVTVEVAKKSFGYADKKFMLYDLPGIYSLQNYSKEEQVATSFLSEHKDDIIINIVDANNLARNLLLTMQLLEKGYNIILAVNMANENHSIDYKKLSKILNIKVVPIDARESSSVKLLMQFVIAENKIDISALNFRNSIPKENNGKFNFIDFVLGQCTSNLPSNYGISKLDKVLLNKWLALPIFLIVMLLVFVITFGTIGSNFSALINSAFGFLTDKLNNLLCSLNISSWAHNLLMQGLIGGLGVVVGFLPQVVLLFLCMNFLEDVGYLSRVAIMFDGFMEKLGLSGKSLFSMLLGFGCTTTAMLTTRALDSQNLRKRTALVVPFASCSAKLPVFALICSAFFAKHKALMVFFMYFLGILVGILVSVIAQRITQKSETNFVMELPPLRLPTIKKTLINLYTNVLNFIKRVGGTLIVCSLLVWIFSNLSFSFSYVTDVQDSILYVVANAVYPIFKPLGFSSPLVVVALLVGIVAKEMVISCLAISNGVVGNLSLLATSLTLSTSPIHFDAASAVGFLVFILLYSPCLSAISVTAKEISKKFALFVFVFQFALAYCCAFLFKTVTQLFVNGKIFEGIIICLIVALAIIFVLQYKKNKCKICNGASCGENCLSK